MEEKFEVQFLKEVFDFLDELDEKARDKILFNIDKARFTNNSEIFKKLDADIWEFRTLFNRTQYRLFAFWDKSDQTVTIVVATHGIIKKTQKTPKKEIDKAVQIMKNYFDNKDSKNKK